MNRSTCNTCKKLVPADTVERDSKVYLVKDCRACGTSETLISGDAARYQRKRSLDPGFEYQGCGLNCLGCRHKTPNIVFVDVTNRCNLNCPICINNTPSMGFLFEPPLEYFDKVFQHYAAMNPPPSIQLFGGEPTVRDDLFDIIRMARSHGLATRVVTNGIKLADLNYCRRLIETKATILIAYDGDNPDTYRILRNNEKSLQLKQTAIENIRRIGGAKVTLMCLAAKGFNDTQLPGLFQFCHDRRDVIRAIYFMPLAHTWNRERFDLEPDRITGEDIEQIVADAFPGDPVAFLPAMFLGEVPTLVKYLNIKPLPFAGAHPNCESMYMLVSDGKQYRPLGHFLKSPVEDFARALRKVEERLARRDLRIGLAQAKGGKPTLRQRLLKLRTILAVAHVMHRHGRLSRVLKGRGLGKLWHALALP
ncbi:MAG: radical SAM protein, partial [Planctomycetes bacterium]|nr:radical SAM protein [Planctomycetota bacterium]